MAIVANILPGVRAVAVYNLYTSEWAKVSINARDHSGKNNKESRGCIKTDENLTVIGI